MSSYQSSAELKASAKEHMFGHYGTAIAASLLTTFVSYFLLLAVPGMFGDTGSVIGACLYYGMSFLATVLTGLLASGISYFYLKIACGQRIAVSDVLQGFRLHPDKALAVQAWIALLTCATDLPRFIYSSRVTAWSDTRALTVYALLTLLNAIVSVAVRLFYAQAFYLLHDFPQYSARELLAMSRRLMAGNKRRLLYIYLSFVPYLLPGALSCGIAMLWVIPYRNATLTEFYLDIVTKNR